MIKQYLYFKAVMWEWECFKYAKSGLCNLQRLYSHQGDEILMHFEKQTFPRYLQIIFTSSNWYITLYNEVLGLKNTPQYLPKMNENILNC